MGGAPELFGRARVGGLLRTRGEPPDQGGGYRESKQFWPGVLLIVGVVMVVDSGECLGKKQAEKRDEGD